jgi:hypothetical protein
MTGAGREAASITAGCVRSGVDVDPVCFENLRHEKDLGYADNNRTFIFGIENVTHCLLHF